jgi:hypothetical protein
MTGIALLDSGRSRLWLVLLGFALFVGAYLRLEQISVQVLIDDEWHAVHQVLHHSPREMFLDFGFADYSIPLGLLDWYEAQTWGVSELSLRWPMLGCGLVTLAAFPLYVMGRLGRATSALYALLLALSPLLVIFTRMARPYAITLLLGWTAHAAYQRYHAATRGAFAAGAVYSLAAALATWLHPVTGPFVAAPLLWGLVGLRHAGPARRESLLRWMRIAIATGALTAAVVVPPLLAHPLSLSAKGGADLPDLSTWIGVWYAWLGTPSTAAVIVCLAFAAWGAPIVWRALPVARTGAIGIALVLLLIVTTRPMWSYLPITVSRYLLPVIPLLLLCAATGTVRASHGIADRLPWRDHSFRQPLALLVIALPVVLLAVQSPLLPLLRHPNAQTQHLVNYIDFRPDKNPYLPQFDAMPLSPFWARLAARPAGTVRVAAAPFYFESFDWDAPRWERLSGQTVIPGYLTGLCVQHRSGELPQDPRYRFANAVHLADAQALAEKRIDYVAWQKPYVLRVAGHSDAIGNDTASCEDALRAKFGRPEFEDSHIIVFPVSYPNSAPASGTPPNAAR